MKPFPTEMRKLILDDLNSGMTWVTSAQKWKISVSFIAKLKPHYTLLQKIVEEKSDDTLVEIQDLLPIKVSHQTVANALHKLKLVYKKTLKASE